MTELQQQVLGLLSKEWENFQELRQHTFANFSVFANLVELGHADERRILTGEGVTHQFRLGSGQVEIVDSSRDKPEWWNELHDGALADLPADWWLSFSDLKKKGHSFTVFDDMVQAGFADKLIVSIGFPNGESEWVAKGVLHSFRQGTGQVEERRREIPHADR